ncbi:hypothetical protein [Gloeocapsopsis dulcis]|uniref:DNA methylase adenine-specific domain-containing protein n=1 Tax=Gloeocapsopsis dulcis AAB1 = 1H9 TaxID=1433147 RepID=A0A6N8FWU6_9CHRO|nr:hypothetical protein [Gloeocapsopsis dulcis]MUL36416.1 hypothetical protein [Gloeocapsopsis dulcis AAB1 = 1H9]WNN88090.1 hypothetical protein P0S91_17545 [Gloeocapsopsis dulcis]
MERGHSFQPTSDEIVRNDYNISPSRYIHVAEPEEFRPTAEILEELEVLEKEAEATNEALKKVLGRFR